MRRAASALLLLLTAFALAGAAPPAPSAVPKVEFVAPGIIERYCAEWSPIKPDPDVLAEIRRRLPEFQVTWDRDGPVLLQATVEITGVPYAFGETLAALHACPDLSNMAAPLMIAAARYTQAAGAAAESGLALRAAREGRLPLRIEPPRPLSQFVYATWHELQHRYVRDLMNGGNAPAPSPLGKYSAETEIVRAHIYLFAIEQLALRRLGREAEYLAREQEIQSKGYKNYIRAMEIVRLETPEAIISELRAGIRQR